MRRRILITLLIISFTTAAFAQYTKKDLVGTWHGTDSGNKIGELIFKDYGKVALNIDGHLMRDLDYKVDLTKTPAPLYITIKTLDGKQQMTLKCLIQFIDNNTLKWQILGDNNDPGNSSITLKRIK